MPRVHIRTPFSIEKNIGRSYNEDMATIPDGDAACFIDGDLMFTTPNFGNILHDYYNAYPEAILTCWTNRIHQLSKGQLHPSMTSTDVLEVLRFADTIKEDRTVTPITGPVSMLLMVVPKSVWNKVKFTEANRYRPDETNMLGVDNSFTNDVRAAGIPVLRMNSLFVYHQYRLLSGTKNHLL